MSIMFYLIAKNVKKLIVCSLFVVLFLFSSFIVFAENTTEVATNAPSEAITENITEVATNVLSEFVTEKSTTSDTNINEINDISEKGLLLFIGSLLLIIVFLFVISLVL